jgi:two-component system, NtrC family, sensor histidine kinase GlrK
LQITYPKSFLKLLLMGFALVMLPLLVAFINANITFGKLTKQSLFNMSQAVETTRASRILLEELAVMERSARQYFVLQDKLLLTNYMNAHQRFGNAMQSLSLLPMAQPLKPILIQFLAQENSLFSNISQAKEPFDYNQDMTDSFNALSQQANKIINENNQLIDQESALFKAKVRRTQQLLFWQTLTLVPLAIIIAGIITWMIARPIRRMDDAIHQLGKGNYEQAIAINGPGDLRQLGSRLDWLRTALKELHQQKQLFLQQASHELKTPLTAIREASELLNDGIAGKLNAEQSDIIRILRDNSLRLQTMIENLLKYTETQFAEMQFAEAQVNHLQLNTAPQALGDIISKIKQPYELSMAGKNINMLVNTEQIMLQKNMDQLQTILDNLISNAVKFTPENGEIQVIAKLAKAMVTIEIIDTGPGVNNDNKMQIFDPFYRGNQANNGLVAGSGLGLFIAKEATTLLKGELTIVAKQTNDDIGAHFILRIPHSSVSFNR